MKLIKNSFFMFVTVLLLTGCISIPLGDSGSVKISKDGLTFKDKEGQETSVNLDKENEKLSISGTDEQGEKWGADIGMNVDVPDSFPPDFFIPDGAIIVSAITPSESASAVTYAYEGDFEKLVEKYKTHFLNNAFDEFDELDEVNVLYEDLETGNRRNMMQAIKGAETYAVILSEDKEEGKIVAVLNHSIKKEN